MKPFLCRNADCTSFKNPSLCVAAASAFVKADAAAVRVGIKITMSTGYKYTPTSRFTGTFIREGASLQCFLYLSFFIGFNDVAHFYVVEVTDCDTAFVTRCDFFHIFLESFQ